MCEWLSHSEWCDVKLLCGGRSFNAHRAVLASVSTFLRQVLLSCPDDATPTFIVLPDFDLEALSSVLFYIYNGEVILQKHKLELFLDIIQAMQIYIDCQYLPEELAEGKHFRFKLSKDEIALKTEIFALGCGKSKDQRFINLKRGEEIQNVLLHNSLRDTEIHDNVVRYQNESELRRSRLGNLKLLHVDRQKNSFLRDLFIETYPRNGNVNGLTEGVLAISNEYYRSPASVLSANANGTHLGNDHSLAGFSTKTYEQTLNLSAQIIHSGQLQFTNNNNEKSESCERVNPTIPCINNPSEASDLTFVYGKSEIKKDFHNDRCPLFPQQSDNSNHLSRVDPSSLDFQQSFLDAMKYQLLNTQYAATQNFALKCGSAIKRKDLKSKPSSKVIFNQVLENPWSPRKPNNFKPSQRICEKKLERKRKVEKIGVVNDSNNNQTPTLVTVEDLSDVVSYKATEFPEIRLPSPLTIAPSIKQNCYKCNHCDQVFTNSESLAVHLRRHSTNARYTCVECGKTFSQLRNFKYHMSIHRGTREFAATCTVCGKYFNDRGYLSSHMKIHRNRKEYKCTLCPKSFNQRVAYNMHVRIHTGVKPHVCTECGKAFSRKMLLKQHQRTHSGERPYACPHCDKRFADRSNMTLHLRLHTGVKPFSCTLCPKSFTKKHHLKSHLNFHTGSKPYSCPRCKLAFTQSSNMRTHYKKCIAPDHVEKIGINMDVSGSDSQSNV